MTGEAEVARLKAEVQRAHARFESLTHGFDAVVLETEPVAGAWSARDLAGHLADWEQEILDAAEHILGGPKPRYQPIKHGQSFNTMRAAVRGADPWDLTMADLVAMRDRALTFLGRLEPAQLRAIGPYPWGEVGTLERLLDDLIAHLDEHAAQVEEWRLRRG